ncbi:hypothetical protein CE159_08660 [Bifidobacterium longum]|nr:hypothetical protein CE159_08660 [Bifidobacterium longum]
MGLFDSLKNMFAHHEHHHGASIGQPLTLADAKAVLAFIVVHQQLADMRKVADAVKQLQDEMPQYITFGMSHDDRDRLFLALFQGFLSLGNLSVTLIFHEAPTGTRK